MVRRIQHLVLRPLLDDLAQQHHHDLVGDRLHGRQVVGNEHVGEVQFLLQPVEELQDFLRHQLVQCRGRLVADDQFRLRRQGAGDANALLLTAREFVRVAIDELIGIEFDHLQQLAHPLGLLTTFRAEIELDGPAENVANALARIERGIRQLVDHLHAPQLALVALLERRRQFLAMISDSAFNRRQEARDGPRQGALAAARLAHDGHGPLLVNFQIDVLEHHDASAVSGGHVLDTEDGRLLLGDFDVLAEGADRDERLGIFLLRLLDHLADETFLDHIAEFQHHDPVGHLRHHRQVVGDVDGRGVELFDDVLDGGQDLDLGGHVERRRRLVEDDEVGPTGHGHGGHRALQLAARDLVRIAEADILRVRQPETPIELLGVLLGLGARLHAVLHGHLAVLLDQLVRRVERGRGTLRHIGDARPAKLSQILFPGLAQVHAVEHDGAVGDPAAGFRVTHGGDADGRLARAGLADQAQNLATTQSNIDAMHDLVPHVVGLAFDAQPPHFQQDVALLASSILSLSAHRAIHSSIARTSPLRNSRRPSAWRSRPRAAAA